MPRTRVLSGNSQAVRIPAELAYADMNIDLEITRMGDVITIFPARDSLKTRSPRCARCRSHLRWSRVNRSMCLTATGLSPDRDRCLTSSTPISRSMPWTEPTRCWTDSSNTTARCCSPRLASRNCKGEFTAYLPIPRCGAPGRGSAARHSHPAVRRGRRRGLWPDHRPVRLGHGDEITME